MKKELASVKKIGGTITVPGDKSIAHRAALMSLLARNPLTVINYPESADCRTSLEVVQKFGVRVNKDGRSDNFHSAGKGPNRTGDNYRLR